MQIPSPNINIHLGRRGGAPVVGLDIQPGFIAAVQSHTNGEIVADRARTVTIASETVRDGEVVDAPALSEALHQLFAGSGLGKRVRVGIANQRTVLRILELPPITDRKELAAAVNFQAQEQVPMPLNNAVLDFHPLGVIDTPAGPRQRVVLVAAQRDMVERLLGAVRAAGLAPEGVDLSAFALIRSLYRANDDEEGRVLYLNVDGLANLAIAEGTVCRFTRVVGSGLEDMAGEVAARLGVSLAEAHTLIAGADLAQEPPEEPAPVAVPETAPDADEHPEEPLGEAEFAERERGMSYEEMAGIDEPPEVPIGKRPSTAVVVHEVLENGVREIAGEVRNSLDFHRSQDGGGEVSHVVLSGAAQDIAGFAQALQQALGVAVREETIHCGERLESSAPAHRLAVATGLSAIEVPR